MPAHWLHRALSGLVAGRSGSKAKVAPLTAKELDEAIQGARLMLVNHKLADAADAFASLMQSNPGDVEVTANFGICLYLLNDTKHASGLLETALGLQPRHALAAKFLAACFERTRDDVRGAAVNQLAVELNPIDPEVLVVAAAWNIRMGRIEEAADLLNRTVKITPENAIALGLFDQLSKQSTLRRELFSKGEKIAAARKRMEKRLLAKEKNDALSDQEAATLLGSLENDISTFSAAHKMASRAQQRDPISANLAEQIASVFWLAGDGEGMLRMRQIAHRLEPAVGVFHLALNHAELMRDPTASTKTWRSLLRLLVESGPGKHPLNIPQWRGERLGRKRLLVYQDQGVGDALLSLRLLSVLQHRGVAFDLWAVPSFRRLAQVALPGVPMLDGAGFPDHRSEYDFAVSLFGLIDALDVNHPEQLQPALIKIERARQPSLSHLIGKRVGLMYRGNPERRDDWLRSIAPSALAPLAALEGVSWVSLMSDERDDSTQIAAMPLHNPMSSVSDFLDTAVLIDQLDAVVAIDSSVAHLAAALGKPLWLAAPTMLDWRWQMADRQSPWWPEVRLHRSVNPGDFTIAVRDIASELRAFLAL